MSANPSNGRPAIRRVFNYDIVDILGHGAASTIYAVRKPAGKQNFALKHVICNNNYQRRFIKQLQIEFDVGNHVNGPQLRKSFELKFARAWYGPIREAALVMEIVEGISLDRHPRLELLPLLACFLQVAGALRSLHTAGFVHCDLKPNNIILADNGTVKVIDLGQACRIGQKKERIQGTPDFIAPEQVRRDIVTVRTDVFNFGATLYSVLCGQPMPTVYTAKQQASLLREDRITPPKAINSRCPEVLSNLVMECVRLNPTKRPADMAEVASRLELLHYAMTRQAQTARVATGGA